MHSAVLAHTPGALPSLPSAATTLLLPPPPSPAGVAAPSSRRVRGWLHTSSSVCRHQGSTVQGAPGRGSLIVVAAAKPKKAKLAQKHPSKQEKKQQLKQQLKSKGMQQPQQQQPQKGQGKQQQPQGAQKQQQQKEQQAHNKQQPNKQQQPPKKHVSKEDKECMEEMRRVLPNVPQLLPKPQLPQAVIATDAVLSSAAAAASAASAAAASAIQAAQRFAPNAGSSSSSSGPGNSSSGGRGGGRGSSSSDWRQQQGRGDMVAGVSYRLDKKDAQNYKAAGVVVYDFGGAAEGGSSGTGSVDDAASPRVLLVREKQGVWNLPAGKITRGVDGSGTPHTTAARELEEESHGLIPAAATTALLPQCPVFYCSESKMAIYLMRYAGGEALPQLLEQRLAAGLKHPAAEGVDAVGWFPISQVREGVMVKTRKGKKGSNNTTAAATAAGAAAADEGEADEAEEGEAAADVADAADAGDASGAAAKAAATEAEAADALASLQLQDTPAAEAPAQGAADPQQQPLPLRMPLFRNRVRIAQWLKTLSRGQAPVVGLQVVQQQQSQQHKQQQQQEQDDEGEGAQPQRPGDQAQQQQQQGDADALPIPAVVPLRLPARWSAYAPPDGRSSAAGGRGAGSSSSSGGGGSGSQQHNQQQHQGQHPWAIAVWSGQHKGDRQQQEAPADNEKP